jgi:hypothetical protein
MLTIPALRRLRWKDLEFKANLGYISRSCLKKTKTKNKRAPRRHNKTN